jgi:hypothetical protein
MFRTVFGLGLVALVAGSPAALAQGRGGWGGGGIGMVIGNSGVHKELKLDDQQIEKAKELASTTREKSMGLREKLQDLDQDERRAKMTELTREINTGALKTAAEFLKPEQLTRLKQIYYQRMGPRAFSDPDIAKKLAITDSQKEEIQSVMQEFSTELADAREKMQDDREAGMKLMAEINNKIVAQAATKLNDEQKKNWKELMGAPYEFKMDPPSQ